LQLSGFIYHPLASVRTRARSLIRNTLQDADVNLARYLEHCLSGSISREDVGQQSSPHDIKYPGPAWPRRQIDSWNVSHRSLGRSSLASTAARILLCLERSMNHQDSKSVFQTKNQPLSVPDSGLKESIPRRRVKTKTQS
jgi:hypothetical protein